MEVKPSTQEATITLTQAQDLANTAYTNGLVAHRERSYAENLDGSKSICCINGRFNNNFGILQCDKCGKEYDLNLLSQQSPLYIKEAPKLADIAKSTIQVENALRNRVGQALRESYRANPHYFSAWQNQEDFVNHIISKLI